MCILYTNLSHCLSVHLSILSLFVINIVVSLLYNHLLILFFIHLDLLIYLVNSFIYVFSLLVYLFIHLYKYIACAFLQHFHTPPFLKLADLHVSRNSELSSWVSLDPTCTGIPGNSNASQHNDVLNTSSCCPPTITVAASKVRQKFLQEVH